MFGFDEWVSGATLSMFRFMPTLGMLPLLKVPLNRQDAKSRQKKGCKTTMDREESMRMIQVLPEFLSCLGGRGMVVVVAAPCGLQDPLTVLTQRIMEVSPPQPPSKKLASQESGGPNGGHLKGEHLEMGFCNAIRARHVILNHQTQCGS